MVTGSSIRPLRLVSACGMLASILNLLYVVYIVLIAIFKKKVAEGWITLSTQHAVMFFFIFVILTVITEYLGQVLLETRDRPLYYVSQEKVSSVQPKREELRNVVSESP